MSKNKETKQAEAKFSKALDKMSEEQIENHQKQLAEKLKPILEKAQKDADEITSKFGISTLLSFHLVLPEDRSEQIFVNLA